MEALVRGGPEAARLIGEALPELDLSDCEAGSIRKIDVADSGVVLVLRTDAAGPETWLLMADQPAVPEVTDRFERIGLSPALQELFDFVRVDNEVPIAGKELTEDVNPLEAGLMDLVDFDKGCYVGQEVIARLDTYDKVQRELSGFAPVADELGEPPVSQGDRHLGRPMAVGRVGWVTSVAQSSKTPLESIGLAYLRKRLIATRDLSDWRLPKRVRRSGSNLRFADELMRTHVFGMSTGMERETGFEPATPCLEGRHSTTELLPRSLDFIVNL